MNNIDDKTNVTQSNARLITVFLVSALVIVIWIWALNWVFGRYAETNYFVWFINYGAPISIMTSFMALVWDGLKDREALLSIHPGEFIAACVSLTAIFFFAITANLANSKSGDGRDLITRLESRWDSLAGKSMLFMMGLTVIGWVIVVSPLIYLLNIVTGAPVRRELRGSGLRLVIDPNAPRLEVNRSIRYQKKAQAIPKGFIDVSLGKQPFAVTNALNAAVLFLASQLLPYI
ncbi:hypothetical protein G8764_16845 [Pseudomaricurvus alcaniphilus]|uniref:hypothetical protein n=1 Tax=Pseudomaricurvus alcaniphilus TaxID=1166482 RepID=UPI001408BDAD|nr:hypothetical protein [Pseudomaricurvus alcaniphilus]NHN38979.1 hypothetical protein [Pseudomaricurvus alcaniphilus]